MNYTELIARMTLEEKASLMSGANFWNTKPVPRLNIPGMMLTDGPHGLRKQGGKEDHLGLNQSIPATCYPTASGLANTWDEELLEEMGRHLGLEAASEGVSVLLGPGVNIKRSPLCGRIFRKVFEIAAAQRISLDINSRSQKHVAALIPAFFTDSPADFLQQIPVK